MEELWGKNNNLISADEWNKVILELKSDIPDSIPQVIGDPTRLRQVIINLVGNAIKFTEKGIVTTSLKIETQQNTININAHFTISDTGIGIEEEKLEQNTVILGGDAQFDLRKANS